MLQYKSLGLRRNCHAYTNSLINIIGNNINYQLMSFEQINILLLIDIFLLIYCDWAINVIGNNIN